MNRTLLLIFLFFFSCSQNQIYSQKTGVLIGLRHDVGIEQPLPYGETRDAAYCSRYRTLWISQDADDSISIVEMKNMVVPRQDGFWKIEIVRQKAKDWVEDFLISTPIHQMPVQPAIDSLTALECEGNKRISLIFVGRDYLSYEGGSDGYCQGAAHPWHENYLKTVSLDDPASEGAKISTALGGEVRTALLDAAKNYLSRKSDERLNPNPGERTWGLIRRRGRWVLRGQLGYAAEAYRGTFAHFDIQFQPIKKLVGFNQLLVPWKKIKQIVPAARDAITSPDRKLLIIVTKDHLSLYSMQANSNFKLIQQIALKPNEFIIMAQWANGNNAGEWEAAIRKICDRHLAK